MNNKSRKKSFSLLKKISYKEFKGSLLRYVITVFSCVVIIVMGTGMLAYATTSIGENIITNILTATGLTVNGNATTTGTLNAEGGIIGDLTGNVIGDLTGTSTNAEQLGNVPADDYSTDTERTNALADYMALSGGTISGNLNVSGNTVLATTSLATTTIFGSLTAKTGRTATFVVAASDSLATSKAQADYVCDGVNDSLTVQEAIDALPSTGGKIFFMEGIYRFGKTITCTKPIHLQGVGYNWRISGGLTRFYPQPALNNTPLFVFEGTWFVGEMTDIGFDGFEAGSHTGHLIDLHAVGGDFQINRCGWYHCAWDTIIHSTAHNIWIHDSFFEENGNDNLDNAVVDIESGVRNRILNCHFRSNKCNYDFRTIASQNWVSGSDFYGGSQKSLYLGGEVCFVNSCYIHGLTDVAIEISYSYMIITDCMINTNDTSAIVINNNHHNLLIMNNDINSHTGLAIEGTGHTNIISGNSFRGTGAKLSSGILGQIRNNSGHTTEASGVATVASATTSIEVPHGLAEIPSTGDIMITPTEGLGNASSFWVDTYGASTFTIHVDVVPGTNVNFAWRAIIL